MIVKIHVECNYDYNYLVNINSSLDLYNSLVINQLLEESEHNIIMCSFYYKELHKEITLNNIKGLKNNTYITLGKYHSESWKKLYEIDKIYTPYSLY